MKIITVETTPTPTTGAILPLAQRQGAVADTTAETLRTRENSLARTEEILRSSSTAQTQSRQGAATGPQTAAGFIQRGAEVGAQLLGRFVDIQQTELQRKAQALKVQEEARKRQEEALAAAAKAAQEARQNEEFALAQDEMQSIILQQPTDGTMVTMSRLTGLRDRYKNLTAEQYAKLRAAGFNDIQNNDTTAIKRITESQEDYRREAMKGAEVSIKANVTPILSALKYEPDAAKRSAMLREIDTEIRRAAKEGNLDTLSILSLRTNILTLALDRNQGNSDSQAEVNAILGDSRTAWTELQKLEDLKGEGRLNETQYRLARQDVLNKYPLASVDQFLTMDGAAQLSYDRQKLSLGVQKLQQEQYEFDNPVSTLENQDVAEAALTILQDPSLRGHYEALDTGDNKRILALADTLEPIRKRLADPARQIQLSNANKVRQTKTSELQLIQQYAADPGLYLDMKEKGLGVPSDISPEKQQALMAEIQAAEEQYRAVLTTYEQDTAVLAQYGVVFDPNSGRLGLNEGVRQERNLAKSRAPAAGTAPPGGSAAPTPSGLPPGFSSGWGGFPMPGPSVPLKGGTKGWKGPVGLVRRGAPLQKVFTGNLYDESPAGSWDFTFIDRNNSDITNLPSPVTGVVTEAGVRGGYGNVVAVQDETTGREWFMAHLNSPAYLKVGQRVVAGQILAKQGTSGNSTGPHVHLEILDRPHKDGGATIRQRNLVEPAVREYFARATTGNWPRPAPRGVGLPPTQRTSPLVGSLATYYKIESPSNAPPGALHLPGGSYVYNGQVVWPTTTKVGTGGGQGGGASGDRVAGAARPVGGGRMSTLRADYPAKNNPTANYGYTSLQKDPAFAKALAGAADRVGIPAQWLADIMAVESTHHHNPQARNGEGAVGLIQFYPGGGLAEVAQEMGVSESEASRRILSMTRAQQMPWVAFYLKKVLTQSGKSRYDRMEDVFAAIWGGVSLLKTPHAQRRGSDSSINYAGYLNRIGSAVGRVYNHHLLRGGTPTHTSFVPGCPACNKMHKTGAIVPHQAPA